MNVGVLIGLSSQIALIAAGGILIRCGWMWTGFACAVLGALVAGMFMATMGCSA